MAKLVSNGNGSIEDQNRMIAIPDSLFTKDGREIRITYWAPVIDIADIPRVTIEGIITKKPLT